MNILMVTNTYLPHVGGVAHSVASFTESYRKLGHRVVVVAPTFPHTPENELDVVRVPAVQNFNGSDFSVQIPVLGSLSSLLGGFVPDVVHSHHPFLLGGTALRFGATYNVPTVFTHHTMYERYTHYVPLDSPEMKRFVVELSTGYANLCQGVIAPSESIGRILIERGVVAPISVVPTGVDLTRFRSGDGARFRRAHQIPENAYVVGHVGRLAPEKNLAFLARSTVRFLADHPDAHCVVVGGGPSAAEIRAVFKKAGLLRQLHLVGPKRGEELYDSYAAMDVFAFSSLSETQGVVVAEAVASGVPVVALDAPGVREVVEDGRNGRLLRGEDSREFAEALQWVRARQAREKSEERDGVGLRAQVLQTAEAFSEERCAERSLQVYREAIARYTAPITVEGSGWESALRAVETEWNLAANAANAVGSALLRSRILASRPVRTARRWWRRIVRAANRSEWAIRALGLKTYDEQGLPPGIVLIQIDGLAREELERAMYHRRMPFLSALLHREGYQLTPVYSGVPSTTPAVQGELFYGVRGAVPAFEFFHRETRTVARMFEPWSAARVEEQLKIAGEGLLQGGSCYSSIYSGGAESAHFCPAAFGWGASAGAGSSLRFAATAVGLGVWHAVTLVRVFGLLLVETVLSLVDIGRGVLRGEHLWKELKFLFARLGVVVLLRELITAGAVVDACRGVPVIHLNYLGYDEHAHRRGPDSLFAHWTLKGIDRSIRRVWRSATRSPRREYYVWIYSDHGQERVRSYFLERGKSLEQAVREVLRGRVETGEGEAGGVEKGKSEEVRGRETVQGPDRGADELHVPSEYGRYRWLSRRTSARKGGETTASVVVCAMGPVGHISFLRARSGAEYQAIALRLVTEQGVPACLFHGESGEVLLARAGRVESFESGAQSLIGENHPYLTEVKSDLRALCEQENSGDIVCLGWRAEGLPLTFPLENGSHGGPGRRETSAFLLLPGALGGAVAERAAVEARGGGRSAGSGAGRGVEGGEEGYLRHGEVRELALEVLERGGKKGGEKSGRKRAEETRARRRVLRRPRTVTVMTYNVHGCVGLDRKLSPHRIARVIAQYGADVVALQELDVRRERSGGEDQAHRIAEQLEMEFHFHPAIGVEEELYGDAVLSAYPLELRRAGALPGLRGRFVEPRGALLVSVDVSGSELFVLNTHLGLLKGERMRQGESLLGPEWLGALCRGERVIVCGDLNDVRGSAVYQQFEHRFRDAQRLVSPLRAMNTWPSKLPLRRIDHVFLSPGLKVRRVEVPRTELTMVASDHLPVIVEIEL